VIDNDLSCRARAEGVSAALRGDRARAELDQTRVALPEAVAAARADTIAVLEQRHAAELGAARAELGGQVARLERELAGERSTVIRRPRTGRRLPRPTHPDPPRPRDVREVRPGGQGR